MPRRLHRALLELIDVFGYSLDEKKEKSIMGGVCHGFTIKWFEAAFLDEDEILEKRIEILRADETIPTIIQNIEAYKANQKQVDGSIEAHYWPQVLGFLDRLGEQGYYWLETLGFFDSLMLFQDSDKFDRVLNNAHYKQTDVMPISILASSERMRQLGGLTTLSSQIRIYTQDELTNYIKDLAKSIDDLGTEAPKKMGFLLHSTNHATGLIYHSKTKHWTFMDINQWPPSAHRDTLDAMSIEIMMGFNFSGSVDKEVSFAVYPIAPKQVLDRMPQWSEAFEKQPPLQALTTELMQRKTFSNFIYIACSCDKPEIIKAVFGTCDLNSPHPSGLTFLVVACLNNALNVIEALHECGVNFEQRDENGSRAIDTAARSSSPEVMRALLKYSDHSTFEGNRVLPIESSKRNNAQVISIFKAFQIDLNQPDAFGKTALYGAVYDNYLETVSALITNGADLNIQDETGRTPLHLAARFGLTQCSMLLIKAGARLDMLDQEGNLPLHIAAIFKKSSILLELIPSKIGLNVQNHEGKTPLHIAIANDDTLTVKSLLVYGADLNLPDHEGDTPLMMVTRRKCDKLISTFLQNGAEVNAVNKEGDSALLIVAVETDPRCISRMCMLLNNGANAALVNAKGETALICAIHHYNPPVTIIKLNELLKYDVDILQVTTAGETAFSLTKERKDLTIFRQLMTYQLQKFATLLCNALTQNNVKCALAVLLVIGVIYTLQNVHTKSNGFCLFKDAKSLSSEMPDSAQNMLVPKKW